MNETSEARDIGKGSLLGIRFLDVTQRFPLPPPPKKRCVTSQKKAAKETMVKEVFEMISKTIISYA